MQDWGRHEDHSLQPPVDLKMEIRKASGERQLNSLDAKDP